MTVEHFWQTLPGYFTFPDFYKHVAIRALSGPKWHGVEVGVYGGQSAAFLGVQLRIPKGLGVQCKLDLVDEFKDFTVDQVRDNLKPIAPVLGMVLQCDSATGAECYENQSLDFVFIDADHRYEAVRRDIAAWLPKVKPGGIISGHDFCPDPFITDGVIRAVTEAFPRVTLWRGERWGDERMRSTGLYYSVWEVEV